MTTVKQKLSFTPLIWAFACLPAFLALFASLALPELSFRETITAFGPGLSFALWPIVLFAIMWKISPTIDVDFKRWVAVSAGVIGLLPWLLLATVLMISPDVSWQVHVRNVGASFAITLWPVILFVGSFIWIVQEINKKD